MINYLKRLFAGSNQSSLQPDTEPLSPASDPELLSPASDQDALLIRIRSGTSAAVVDASRALLAKVGLDGLPLLFNELSSRTTDTDDVARAYVGPVAFLINHQFGKAAVPHLITVLRNERSKGSSGNAAVAGCALGTLQSIGGPEAKEAIAEVYGRASMLYQMLNR